MFFKKLFKPVFVVCCIISAVSFFINWLEPTFKWWYSFWPFAAFLLVTIYCFVMGVLMSIIDIFTMNESTWRKISGE